MIDWTKLITLSGFKTWLGGIGGIALGVYLMTEGKIEEGWAAVSAALVALGIGHKIQKGQDAAK